MENRINNNFLTNEKFLNINKTLQDENIKNSYDKISIYDNIASSNFKIKGKIYFKEGKKINIFTDDNGIKEKFEIITKSNLNLSQGEMLTIKKEEIESIKKISDKDLEKRKEIEEKEKKELEKLDLDPSKENIDAIKKLKEMNIPLTRENILKYAKINGTLNFLNLNLNIDTMINLMSENIDLGNESIFEIKNSFEKFNFNKEEVILNYKAKNKMSYDEAREVSDKIYKNKMGKDIYDIIISLDLVGLDLTKENIDNVYDVFSKVNDLKNIEKDDIARAISKNDKIISIDLLYNVKNYVTKSNIIDNLNIEEVNTEINNFLSNDNIHVLNNNNFQEEKIDIKKIDKNLVNTLKAVINNNLDISVENINNIEEIKIDLEKLSNILSTENIAILKKLGIDLENIDIKDLLKNINSIIENINNLKIFNLTNIESDSVLDLINIKKNFKFNDLLKNSFREVLSEKNISNYENALTFLHKESLKPYNNIFYKTAITVSNLENINFNLIDIRKNVVSLKYLSFKHNIFNDSDNNVDDYKALKVENKGNNNSSGSEDYLKDEIRKHYKYLRDNFKFKHFANMLIDNINPYESDIRSLSNYIKNTNNLKNEFIFGSLSQKNIDELSRKFMNSENINLKYLTKTLDLIENKNNFYNKVNELKNQLKEDFQDNTNVQKIIDNIDRLFVVSKNLSKNNSREFIKSDIISLFNEMKNLENQISEIDNSKKGYIKNRLKDIIEDIKNTKNIVENNYDEQFLMIPFNMNKENSQSNVYVKKNRKTKEIDPKDMKLLIDIKSKFLGKLGFYLKVKDNKISLKISTENNTFKKAKEGIDFLNKELEKIGYELENIDFSSPSNSSKIAFLKEDVQENIVKNSKIDISV